MLRVGHKATYQVINFRSPMRMLIKLLLDLSSTTENTKLTRKTYKLNQLQILKKALHRWTLLVTITTYDFPN